MKNPRFVLALMASVTLISLPALASEPSLHEVYQAADAGRLADAQKMMQEVLQAHPNSGKAHYVEAELLAKAGRRQEASHELARAETLSPGLPFANTESVSHLKHSLGAPSASIAPLANPPQPTGLPLGLWVAGAALLAFVVWAARRLMRENQPGTSWSAASPAPAAPAQGWNPPTPGTGYSTTGAPGMGSQIMSGLATGAAVGAGVVAGEALAHHFLDGRTAGTTQSVNGGNGIPDLPETPINGARSNDDLGGNDFGISGSGWDDGDSGNDWN